MPSASAVFTLWMAVSSRLSSPRSSSSSVSAEGRRCGERCTSARCRRLQRALVHLSAQRRPEAEAELEEVRVELSRLDTAIHNVKTALALGT